MIQKSSAYLDFTDSFHSSKNDNDGSKENAKSNQLNAYGSGNYSVDYYYTNKENRFFKLGGSVDFSSSKDAISTADTTAMETKNTNFSSNVSLILGHGHGRIENVEDAVESMYILNELEEKGILKKKLSSEDIEAFANVVTILKNERYFDTRLYRQKSMIQLVDKLEELDLVDSEAISLYNTIADYHFYAGITPRWAGHKFDYYITPKYGYVSRDNKKDRISNSRNSDIQDLYLNIST